MNISKVPRTVSLGGDSDTLACITSGIAEAYDKVIPEEIARQMWSRLPETFREILREMRGVEVSVIREMY